MLITRAIKSDFVLWAEFFRSFAKLIYIHTYYLFGIISIQCRFIEGSLRTVCWFIVLFTRWCIGWHISLVPWSIFVLWENATFLSNICDLMYVLNYGHNMLNYNFTFQSDKWINKRIYGSYIRTSWITQCQRKTQHIIIWSVNIHSIVTVKPRVVSEIGVEYM